MTRTRHVFDWAGMMRAGIGDLGLAPAVFWALSPAEFLILTGQIGGPRPMTRAGLDALAARFPDGAAPRATTDKG